MNVEELMRKWVAAFLENADEEVDEKTRELLLEACGTACARYHGSIKIARAIGKKTKDIEELLFELNQQKSLWCGKWESACVNSPNCVSSSGKRSGSVECTSYYIYK